MHHSGSGMAIEGAPEELHHGCFGSFAHAGVGVFEVSNELRDIAAEGEAFGLVHLYRGTH